jgi:hypothetical protein
LGPGANLIKLFTTVIYEFSARKFRSGKLFQKNGFEVRKMDLQSEKWIHSQKNGFAARKMDAQPEKWIRQTPNSIPFLFLLPQVYHPAANHPEGHSSSRCQS